jgi:hypothetical protein
MPVELVISFTDNSASWWTMSDACLRNRCLRPARTRIIFERRITNYKNFNHIKSVCLKSALFPYIPMNSSNICYESVSILVRYLLLIFECFVHFTVWQVHWRCRSAHLLPLSIYKKFWLSLLDSLNKMIFCSPEARILKLYSSRSINLVLNLHSFNILYVLHSFRPFIELNQTVLIEWKKNKKN